jgi:hypothetical protein
MESMRSVTRVVLRVLMTAILFSSAGAFAIKVPTGTPKFDLNVNVLLQARAQFSWDGELSRSVGAGPGSSPYGTLDTDFYIRRARLIVFGSGFSKLTYYIMLDTPNFGIRGNYTGSTFIQDLHIGYQPVKNVDIEMGFLYMPLNHLALLSSSSTSSIEKGTAILFYNNARGLREAGIHARALILNERLYLRGGVFNGLHGRQGADAVTGPVNGNGRPLVAGMARFNLIGSESGYSFPNLYMDGKSRVSFGAGGQWQGKGSNTPITRVTNAATGARTTVLTAVNDYLALSADFFANIALPNDQETMLEVNFVRFDWGSGSDKTGNGLTVEAGYRIGDFEPEVNGYWFNSDSKQNSFLKVAGGINYFIQKHQARIGLEFVHIKSGVNFDASTAVHQILLQTQISF